MKIRKFASAIMVIAMISALTSCTSSPNVSSGATTSVSNTTASNTQPVTITFWHNYDESAGQIDVLNQLITQFENDNPGIKVNQLYLEWSALKNNVIAGATTKMLPDVLRGDIAFVPQFQSLNVLVEMSSLPDYSSLAAKLLDAPNSTAKMGDKFYGVAADTNTKILFYNKDLLTKAGLSVPTTLDEMWNSAAKLSGSGKYGFVEAWTGIWNVGPYIWSSGGDVLSKDYSTATGYINGPITVSVIQKLADLYKAKQLTGPTLDPGAAGDTDGWAAGTYAMEVDGPWRAVYCDQAKINYGAAILPAGSKGSISVLGGEDFMMFQTSDDAHKAASWKFIQFMDSKDAQVAMAKVGQMPVNKEALTDQTAIQAIPLLPVFSQALQTARPRPVIPQWSDIEDVIATKVNEAITGVKPVQQAMDEAADAVNAILAKK